MHFKQHEQSEKNNYKKGWFSTRIKMWVSNLTFARRRLFYTAGSRNGLEGVAARGYTYEVIKRNPKSARKGLQLSQHGKTQKNDMTEQIRIQKFPLAQEIRHQGLEKALDMVPGPRNVEKSPQAAKANA